MSASQVERKVYFFRVTIPPFESGEVPKFDCAAALKKLGQIRFHAQPGPKSRYMQDADTLLAAWPMVKKDKLRLSFGRVRRAGLPSVEQLGQVDPLNIGNTQGLVEQSHLCIFDNNIIGAEYNHFAPRTSRLADYFAEKLPTPEFPNIRLISLLNKDAMRQLERMEDIRLVRVQVNSSALDLLERAEHNLPESLAASRQQYGAEYVDITLRAPKGKKLSDRARDLLYGLVGRPDSRFEDVRTLQARGRDAATGKVELFDFMKDKFVSRCSVVKHTHRYRSVDANSMFNAIETAYNEMREELEHAAGVVE